MSLHYLVKRTTRSRDQWSVVQVDGFENSWY